MSIVLIPYVNLGPRWSLEDQVMVEIYRLMDKEGSARTVFCSGTVTDPESFLSFAKDKRNQIVTAWDEGILGIGWINGIQENFCFAHFSMFKQAWGTQSLSVGRMFLDYWFGMKINGTPLFRVIIGMIPEDNRRAINFIKKLGLIQSGYIPGIIYDIYNRKYQGVVIFYEIGV
jgi:hypothetical protein